MQKKKYSDRFFNQLIKSWWVKVPTNIFIFVITVVSAFLEFRNAGLTTLFWGLFAASTAIVLLNIAFIVIPLVKEWLKEKENKKAQQKTFLDYRSKITILYSHYRKSHYGSREAGSVFQRWTSFLSCLLDC